MNTGVATSPNSGALSILDKPLHELTEDDICQLTREDCRRYLKSKGMRRPSWNKSQAIQQVISLKSLLEPPPPPLASLDSKVIADYPPEIPALHVISNSSCSVKELSPADGEATASMSADDGLSGSDLPKEVDSLRDADVSNLQLGQMTIFYCGKVNVYDGVPVEKAQTIMQLAAGPSQYFQDVPIDRNFAQWATNCHFPGSSVKVNGIPEVTTVSHQVQTGKIREYIQEYRKQVNVAHESDVNGHTNRQVSLQRYLGKRKDRERFRIRKKMGPSSGLEMYLNQQMRIQVLSGQSSPSGVSSQTQSTWCRPQCSFIENQSKNAGCAADLSDSV